MLGIPSEVLTSAKTVMYESPRRKRGNCPVLTPPSVASSSTTPLIMGDVLQLQHEVSPLHVEDFLLCLEGYSQDRIILAQGPVYHPLWEVNHVILPNQDQGWQFIEYQEILGN